MSKLITVFGATGIQGGSVVKGILSSPTLSKEYKIRAVTRDPQKKSAQDLAAHGVELAKANLDNEASVKQAIDGSYAVFAVTNFWEKHSKEAEVKQGKAIADSSKAAGVKHLVWSALPNVTKMTAGELSAVEHFDGKAEVMEYIDQTKGDMVATYFMAGCYMSNIKGMIRKGEDGVLTIRTPWVASETKLPLFDAGTDTGKYVAGILSQDPERVNGLQVKTASQWATPNEIVDTLTKVTGTTVKFQEIPEEVFQSFLPEKIAREVTENMLLLRDHSYYGKGAEKEQEKSDWVLGGEKTVSWEQFIQNNGPWQW